MKKRISIVLALSMVLSLFSVVAHAADTDVYFDITYQTTNGETLDTTTLKKGDAFYAVVSLAGDYDKVAGTMIALSWNNAVIAPVKTNLTDDATTFGQATTSRLDNNSALKTTIEVEDPDSGEMVETPLATFKQAGTALSFDNGRGFIKYNATVNTDVASATGEGAYPIGNNPVMKIRFIVKGEGNADLKVNTSETIKIGAFSGDSKKEYVQTDALSLVDIATLEVGSAAAPQSFNAKVPYGAKAQKATGIKFNLTTDDATKNVKTVDYTVPFFKTEDDKSKIENIGNIAVGLTIDGVPSGVTVTANSAELY